MPLEMRILLVGRVLASNAQMACPQCQHQEAKASLGHESTSKREEKEEEERRKKKGGGRKEEERRRGNKEEEGIDRYWWRWLLGFGPSVISIVLCNFLDFSTPFSSRS